MCILGALSAAADTTWTGDELPSEGLYDCTSYVTNPDFSDKTMSGGAPTGWSWTGSSSYSKISTAAKGGGVIPADQPHWQVWNGTGTMSQTVSSIPNGTYYMTCTIVDNKTGDNVFANDATVSIATDAYYYCVKVEVTDGTLKLGINKAVSGSCIELDDVQLYSTTKPVVKKKVFSIGDSTMANKSSATERGWGMFFGNFLDSESITYTNYGIDGYSTKSYIDGGKWTTVLGSLSAGDYVLIQFGHNDEKTDASLHTDPETTFTENLTKFVIEARAKGANPVFISPIVRRKFSTDGNIYNDHTAYTAAMQALASSLSVPYIDMTQFSAYYENIAGIVGSRSLHEYYPGTATDALGEIDNTHLCALGAYITARCVAEQIALDENIDIALNTNPDAMDGAYSSTLEYAQHALTALYSDIDGTQYSSLADLDAAVRARRHADRQALANPASATDATFCVVNSDMLEGMAWDNDVQSTVMMGWQFDRSTSGTFNNTFKRAAGVTYFGPWAAQVDYMDIHQTITDIPDGTYRIDAYVKGSTGTGKITADGVGANFIYATSGEQTSRADLAALESWETVSTICTVTGGTLTIGLRSEYGCYARLSSVTLTALAPVSATLKVTDAQFATFIAPFDVELPEGVKAYTVSADDYSNGVITLSEGMTSVAANTPVVLYSETEVEKTYTGYPANTSDTYTEGLLTGTYSALYASMGSYVLQDQDGHVAFYLVSADDAQNVPANRAYLTLPESSDVKTIKFVVGGETSISTISGTQTASSAIYDLSGRRVSTMSKGLYIQGGKKYIVK